MSWSAQRTQRRAIVPARPASFRALLQPFDSAPPSGRLPTSPGVPLNRRDGGPDAGPPGGPLRAQPSVSPMTVARGGRLAAGVGHVPQAAQRPGELGQGPPAPERDRAVRRGALERRPALRPSAAPAASGTGRQPSGRRRPTVEEEPRGAGGAGATPFPEQFRRGLRQRGGGAQASDGEPRASPATRPTA